MNRYSEIEYHISKSELIKALNELDNGETPTRHEIVEKLKASIVQLNNQDTAFHIDVSDPLYLEMMAIGYEAYLNAKSDAQNQRPNNT